MDHQNFQGDLTDIFRASTGAGAMNLAVEQPPISDWEFALDPINNIPATASMEDFGDPFSTMRDPFLNELDIAGSSSGFFHCSPDSAAAAAVEENNFFTVEMKRACNIFPQMPLQIAPRTSPSMAAASSSSSSPRGIEVSAMGPSDMISANSTGVQISSSPRIPVGVKRRKSQAKKVVCIPAPAAANSRPTGEVVPSDLWAWRKYGQKPIKGSPYPRGYYRCSSSKGCSARKQVERSRNDPNMLVITYTSEHNHPWPTQRNALAGSTRSQQPSKNTASKTTLNATKKEEDVPKNKEASAGNNGTTSVKEEMEEIEKQMDMAAEEEDQEEFAQSYRPALMAENSNNYNQCVDQDFFADLGEIEAVPVNLLFAHGFEQKESKNLDPFGLFDWSGDNPSFGEEAKRGL